MANKCRLGLELDRQAHLGVDDDRIEADGLEIVDRLVKDGSLKSYHLLNAVRGDMLFKLGRMDEARDEFDKAARMTRNDRERQLFEKRKAECT